MKKIVFSAAFVVMGTFAMAQQTPMMNKKDPAQMEQKRQEKLKMMQAELNLTSAQVAQIKALQDKKMAEKQQNASQMQEQRKAKMEAMKARQEQWNAEMRKILTPEQYQKWETKKQQNMQNKRQKMQKHQMKRMSVTN